VGICGDPDLAASLQDGGAGLVRPQVPITVTTTLSDSPVIDKILLKRVRALSQDPAHEAVVVLAHGSQVMAPSWDKFLRRSVTYICGQTGISYGDWKTVGMGHNAGGAVQVVREAATHRDHVIVVGAYIGTGVTRMLRSSGRGSQGDSPMRGQMPTGGQGQATSGQREGRPPQREQAGADSAGHGGGSMMMRDRANPLEGVNVRLADKGLLPDELVTQWIVEVSRQAVRSR
jgi:hypothetical protein